MAEERKERPPLHDASEGGFALHGDNAKRDEIMAGVLKQQVIRKQYAKLNGTPIEDAILDEDKLPAHARDADESVEED